MKDLRISVKLIILVAISIISLITISTLAVINLGNVNEQSTEISSNWLKAVAISGNLNTVSSNIRLFEYKLANEENENELNELKSQINSYISEFENELHEYETTIYDDEDRKIYDELNSVWFKYKQVNEKITQSSITDDIQELFENSETMFNELSDEIILIVTYNANKAAEASKKGDNIFNVSRNVIIISCIIIVIILALLNFFIIKSILSPIREIDYVAKAIANGNLNERIMYKSKAELGILASNFNKTVEKLNSYVVYIDEITNVLDDIANGNLCFKLTHDYAGNFAKIKTALENVSNVFNDTLTNINQSAEQVANGSSQVADGAQQLAQGATEQASSVQELASTINIVSKSIKTNAEAANDISIKATGFGKSIEKGNSHMNSVKNSMDDISDSSKEIGKIIKLIEDIAFQTNILALNAAVEAARAGEAGRGFSVVADEVRNLAVKSAEAASNTTQLIENSIKAIDSGSKIADEAVLILNSIAKETEDIIKTIKSIANASNNDSKSVLQIADGIEQISNVVQTNSSTAEESAATSEELSGQASILKSLVNKFKLKNAIYSNNNNNVNNSDYNTPVYNEKIVNNIELHENFSNQYNFDNDKY